MQQKSVQVSRFAQGLRLAKCAIAALVLTDLSTPRPAVIPQSDVTRTSPYLTQKRIVTLIPGRTDPRISSQRPISIKLISRAA